MAAVNTICDLEVVWREGQARCQDLHLPPTASEPVPVIVGIPGGGWRQTTRKSVPSRLWRFDNAGHSWLVEQTEAEIAAFFHNVFMPGQSVKEQGTTV